MDIYMQRLFQRVEKEKAVAMEKTLDAVVESTGAGAEASLASVILDKEAYVDGIKSSGGVGLGGDGFNIVAPSENEAYARNFLSTLHDVTNNSISSSNMAVIFSVENDPKFVYVFTSMLFSEFLSSSSSSSSSNSSNADRVRWPSKSYSESQYKQLCKEFSVQKNSNWGNKKTVELMIGEKLSDIAKTKQKNALSIASTNLAGNKLSKLSSTTVDINENPFSDCAFLKQKTFIFDCLDTKSSSGVDANLAMKLKGFSSKNELFATKILPFLLLLSANNDGIYDSLTFHKELFSAFLPPSSSSSSSSQLAVFQKPATKGLSYILDLFDSLSDRTFLRRNRNAKQNNYENLEFPLTAISYFVRKIEDSVYRFIDKIADVIDSKLVDTKRAKEAADCKINAVPIVVKNRGRDNNLDNWDDWEEEGQEDTQEEKVEDSEDQDISSGLDVRENGSSNEVFPNAGSSDASMDAFESSRSVLNIAGKSEDHFVSTIPDANTAGIRSTKSSEANVEARLIYALCALRSNPSAVISQSVVDKIVSNCSIASLFLTITCRIEEYKTLWTTLPKEEQSSILSHAFGTTEYLSPPITSSKSALHRVLIVPLLHMILSRKVSMGKSKPALIMSTSGSGLGLGSSNSSQRPTGPVTNDSINSSNNSSDMFFSSFIGGANAETDVSMPSSARLSFSEFSLFDSNSCLGQNSIKTLTSSGAETVEGVGGGVGGSSGGALSVDKVFTDLFLMCLLMRRILDPISSSSPFLTASVPESHRGLDGSEFGRMFYHPPLSSSFSSASSSFADLTSDSRQAARDSETEKYMRELAESKRAAAAAATVSKELPSTLVRRRVPGSTSNISNTTAINAISSITKNSSNSNSSSNVNIDSNTSSIYSSSISSSSDYNNSSSSHNSSSVSSNINTANNSNKSNTANNSNNINTANNGNNINTANNSSNINTANNSNNINTANNSNNINTANNSNKSNRDGSDVNSSVISAVSSNSTTNTISSVSKTSAGTGVSSIYSINNSSKPISARLDEYGSDFSEYKLRRASNPDPLLGVLVQGLNFESKYSSISGKSSSSPAATAISSTIPRSATDAAYKYIDNLQVGTSSSGGSNSSRNGTGKVDILKPSILPSNKATVMAVTASVAKAQREADIVLSSSDVESKNKKNNDSSNGNSNSNSSGKKQSNKKKKKKRKSKQSNNTKASSNFTKALAGSDDSGSDEDRSEYGSDSDNSATDDNRGGDGVAFLKKETITTLENASLLNVDAADSTSESEEERKAYSNKQTESENDSESREDDSFIVVQSTRRSVTKANKKAESGNSMDGRNSANRKDGSNTRVKSSSVASTTSSIDKASTKYSTNINARANTNSDKNSNTNSNSNTKLSTKTSNSTVSSSVKNSNNISNNSSKTNTGTTQSSNNNNGNISSSKNSTQANAKKIPSNIPSLISNSTPNSSNGNHISNSSPIPSALITPFNKVVERNVSAGGLKEVVGGGKSTITTAAVASSINTSMSNDKSNDMGNSNTNLFCSSDIDNSKLSTTSGSDDNSTNNITDSDKIMNDSSNDVISSSSSSVHGQSGDNYDSSRPIAANNAFYDRPNDIQQRSASPFAPLSGVMHALQSAPTGDCNNSNSNSNNNIVNFPPLSSNPMSGLIESLSSNIIEFNRRMDEQMAVHKLVRRAVIRRLNALLHRLGKGSKGHHLGSSSSSSTYSAILYGSSVTNLALPYSDIDIVLVPKVDKKVSGKADEKSKVGVSTNSFVSGSIATDALSAVYSLLLSRQQDYLVNLNFLPHASIPIIKAEIDPEKILSAAEYSQVISLGKGANCDLSSILSYKIPLDITMYCEGHRGLVVTNFVKYLLNGDPAAGQDKFAKISNLDAAIQAQAHAQQAQTPSVEDKQSSGFGGVTNGSICGVASLSDGEDYPCYSNDLNDYSASLPSCVSSMPYVPHLNAVVRTLRGILLSDCFAAAPITSSSPTTPSPPLPNPTGTIQLTTSPEASVSTKTSSTSPTNPIPAAPTSTQQPLPSPMVVQSSAGALGKPFLGGLSSYATIIVVVAAYYRIRIQRGLNLTRDYLNSTDNSSSNSSGSINTSGIDCISSSSSSSSTNIKVSCGELLLQSLDLIAMLNWQTHGIDIFNKADVDSGGGCALDAANVVFQLSLEQVRSRGTSCWIEDPLQPGVNITRSSYQFTSVQCYARHCLSQLFDLGFSMQANMMMMPMMSMPLSLPISMSSINMQHHMAQQFAYSPGHFSYGPTPHVMTPSSMPMGSMGHMGPVGTANYYYPAPHLTPFAAFANMGISMPGYEQTNHGGHYSNNYHSSSNSSSNSSNSSNNSDRNGDGDDKDSENDCYTGMHSISSDSFDSSSNNTIPLPPQQQQEQDHQASNQDVNRYHATYPAVPGQHVIMNVLGFILKY